MENLADLERKYEELGKEIERLKNEQNKGRIVGKRYWYIDDCIDVESTTDAECIEDTSRFRIGNYFKTETEAVETLEKMKVYTELKRLAERLNNGRKIDWRNPLQEKYVITLKNTDNTLTQYHFETIEDLGQIYCLDNNFKDIAMKEIGEDRLRKLFE